MAWIPAKILFGNGRGSTDDLIQCLKKAELELRRLHHVHTPTYEGKIGEPDLEIAREARKVVAAARWRRKHGSEK